MVVLFMMWTRFVRTITWTSISTLVSVKKCCKKRNKKANLNPNSNLNLVCRHLLSLFAVNSNEKLNLLHSIPAEIETKFNLNELLKKCAYNKENRIESARLINLVLNQIHHYTYTHK